MVSDADGSEYRMRAVYMESARPERLVWTEPDRPDGGMTTTITVVDLGDGRTEVITHRTNTPEAYCGFLTSLDRCDAYLASLVARAR